MRFLENMVSDLVKQSTGFNPKKVIRMVGGKNILMAGAGAALAGALAHKSGAMGGLGQGAAGHGAAGTGPFAPGTPPPHLNPSAAPPAAPPATVPSPSSPPPPVPGHAAPPPLPSVPAAQGAPPPLPPVPGAAAVSPPDSQATDDDQDVDPQVTFAIVRTMVAAALSDGHMAPEEKSSIQGRLAESGLDEAAVRQIHQDLVLPPSPAELAAMVPDPAMREALFRFAALVVITDQEVSDLERRWLDRLAAAFELPADRQRALEDETLGAFQ